MDCNKRVMRYLAIVLLFTVTSASSQIYHRDPCPPSGGLTYTVDSFTANGTWTKPAGTDFVILYITGGGGGGRGGRRGAAGTNRGGGGAYSSPVGLFVVPASVLSATESVVVATGSAGGAGATADNTNGSFSAAAGASYFKSSTFASVGGGSSVGGSTTVVSTSSTTISITSDSVLYKIMCTGAVSALGTSAPSDGVRAFSATNSWLWRGHSTVGGSINSSNTQFNAATIPGFYINDNTLVGEQSGAGEGVNASALSNGFLIGDFIARIFPWFDPADISGELPRGGMSGGPGDTAGTVAGGNGERGRGYGAAGGGGGASTNGANAGSGADGNDGVVIVISVDYE